MGGLLPGHYRRCPKVTARAKQASGAGDDSIIKPSATRHLFLIRHGQYVMDPHSDENRILTELGRSSAASHLVNCLSCIAMVYY